MGIEKTVSQFRSSNPDDVDEVIGEMDRLARNAPGWMNLQPWVDDEQVIEPNLLRRIFGASGDPVPTATWVPAASSGDTTDQIGITHGSGPGASRRLADRGIAFPAGWLVKSDHRRRGLVVVGTGGDNKAILGFMLDASAALSGVATDDRWLCGVSRRG